MTMCDDDECPKCGSPAPHLHPAVQCEGEVQPCDNEFHLRPTPDNTPYLPGGRWYRVALNGTQKAMTMPTRDEIVEAVDKAVPSAGIWFTAALEAFFGLGAEDIRARLARIGRTELKQCIDCLEFESCTMDGKCAAQATRKADEPTQAAAGAVARHRHPADPRPTDVDHSIAQAVLSALPLQADADLGRLVRQLRVGDHITGWAGEWRVIVANNEHRGADIEAVLREAIAARKP